MEFLLYLVDCLVAPGKSIRLDVHRGDDNIRCRRLIVTGGTLLVSKGTCTTRFLYAKLLDEEMD
jgi:hypothetical protein